jgi:hypothetical protein
MRLLEGRKLAEADTPPLGPATQLNVVVNQAFVHRFFPGIDPIGKRFGIRHIVGVVSDSRYRSLREPVAPTFYAIGSGYAVFMLNVRTRIEPKSIFRPVERVLSSIDPSLAFLEENTLSQQVDESMAAEKLEATLATFFGALAALLAGLGIFGLLAHTVSQRYREIGIRMSLGARPIHIRRLIGGQVVVLTAAGVAIGLAGSLFAGRWMRSLVYGVSAFDPLSLALSAIFVAAIALVAALVPTRRAASIDPAESLRMEG